MINNNQELTIGELDAVNGGLLELIAQFMQAYQKAIDPLPAPTQNGAPDQFQQMLHSIPPQG
jgi:hypothetical protein